MPSILFLIPARAGSKGVPGKNYKELAGKPLIKYPLELARKFTADINICISTDDKHIEDIVKADGYELPFIRPPELSSDKAGAYEVMLHAIEHYSSIGRNYQLLVYLQPTSPFRTFTHVKESISKFQSGMDILVSVKETKANPYYLLMEEDENGWLQHSKKANFVRRQDTPTVYELNGAIYVINVESLKNGPINSFKKIGKYVMDEVHSIDIDSPLDWIIAETFLEKGVIDHEI